MAIKRMTTKRDEQQLRACVEKIRVRTPGWRLVETRFHQWMQAAMSGVQIVALVVGESGTGKSEILKHLLRQLPHTLTAEGIVRPLVLVEVPHHATSISLLKAILMALGDPVPEKGDREDKLRRLKKLLQEQSVRFIFLDDLQHLVDKGQDIVLYDAAECLKEIMIGTKVSIVAAGLEDAKKVVDSNEQLKRRNRARVEVNRFDWANEESREEFVGLLAQFQKHLQEFELPNLSSREMAFRMYLASGGLVDFVSSILMQAIWNALDAKRWKISIRDLAKARDEALWDDGQLGKNPFSDDFSVRKCDLESQISAARRINARVARPVSKRSQRAKKHLARVGL